MQYIADALENKTEKHGAFSYFVNNRHHSTQSLTVLNLAGNNFGDQGAEHLAHALQKNKVI